MVLVLIFSKKLLFIMSQNISLIDAIIRLRKMDGLLFPLSLATVAPLLYIYLAEVPQGGS